MPVFTDGMAYRCDTCDQGFPLDRHLHKHMIDKHHESLTEQVSSLLCILS